MGEVVGLSVVAVRDVPRLQAIKALLQLPDCCHVRRLLRIRALVLLRYLVNHQLGVSLD